MTGWGGGPSQAGGDRCGSPGAASVALVAGMLVLARPAAATPQILERDSDPSVESSSDEPQGPGRRHYQEAMGLMLAGLTPAAAAAFERAIAVNPTEARYHNNLTAVLLQSNDTLEDAERAALRGLEHVPGHAPLWINLGIARQRLGRPAEAARALETGLEHDPESGEGHAWLARAYWRLARASEPADAELLARAASSMETATQHQPESPVTHFQLGLILELIGDDDAALPVYRRASALAPEHPQGRAKVAELEARLAARASDTAPAGAAANPSAD